MKTRKRRSKVPTKVIVRDGRRYIVIRGKEYELIPKAQAARRLLKGRTIRVRRPRAIRAPAVAAMITPTKPVVDVTADAGRILQLRVDAERQSAQIRDIDERHRVLAQQEAAANLARDNLMRLYADSHLRITSAADEARLRLEGTAPIFIPAPPPTPPAKLIGPPPVKRALPMVPVKGVIPPPPPRPALAPPVDYDLFTPGPDEVVLIEGIDLITGRPKPVRYPRSEFEKAVLASTEAPTIRTELEKTKREKEAKEAEIKRIAEELAIETKRAAEQEAENRKKEIEDRYRVIADRRDTLRTAFLNVSNKKTTVDRLSTALENKFGIDGRKNFIPVKANAVPASIAINLLTKYPNDARVYLESGPPSITSFIDVFIPSIGSNRGGAAEGSPEDIAKYGISNIDIDEYLDPLAPYGFLGTFSSDDIAKQAISKIAHLKEPRLSFVSNTDPHNKPGQHWVAIYIDARHKRDDPNAQSVEYYDSFGTEPTQSYLRQLKQIVDHLVDKFGIDYYLKFKWNRVVQQSATSYNCGWFCLRFIVDRYNNLPFIDATGWSEVAESEQEIDKFKDKVKKFGYIYRPKTTQSIVQ